MTRDRGNVVDGVSNKFDVELFVRKLSSRDIKPHRVCIRGSIKELEEVPSE